MNTRLWLVPLLLSTACVRPSNGDNVGAPAGGASSSGSLQTSSRLANSSSQSAGSSDASASSSAATSASSGMTTPSSASSGSGVVGVAGQPCPMPDATACAGYNQRQVLYCQSVPQQWVTDPMLCLTTQRCDTTPGASAGTCQDIVTECQTHAPGESYCLDNARITCGPDRVSFTSDACLTPQVCGVSVGPGCAQCDTAADCTNPVAECEERVCTAQKECDKMNRVDGFLLDNTAPTDCAQNVCIGGIRTLVVDSQENCGANTTCAAPYVCRGTVGASCANNQPTDAGVPFCVTAGGCVNGYCCDGACNGLCERCDRSNSQGTCTPGPNQDNASCQAPLYACNAAGTECLKGVGQPCSGSAECATQACVDLYVDGDADGWATSTPGGTRCAFSVMDGQQYFRSYDPSTGSGLSSRTGDCCDSDSEAHPDAYPGQISPQSMVNACGSWDWNCNTQQDSYFVGACTCSLCTPQNSALFCYPGGLPACGISAPAEVRNCSAGCALTQALGNTQRTCF